jgi:hypothetical protein
MLYRESQRPYLKQLRLSPTNLCERRAVSFEERRQLPTNCFYINQEVPCARAS